MKRHTLAVLMAATALLSACANANTITFVTPSSATTVDASATFVTSAGALTITLANLEVNPTDESQAISDLSFTLSSGQTSGTLDSSGGMGIQRTINTIAAGGFTDTATTAAEWTLNGLEVGVSGTPIAPAHMIIGPPGAGDAYSNANGTIAGNLSNNPFLAGDVIFTIDIPTLTSNDSVNSATFSFGTLGSTVAGVLVPPIVGVPDGGATLPLLGGALSALGLVRRKLV